MKTIDPRLSYDRGPWVPPADAAEPAASQGPSQGAAERRAAPQLSGVTIADLEKELERRQGALAKLAARRERVAAELAAVEKEMALLDSEPAAPVRGEPRPAKRAPRTRGPRPKNSLSLPKAMLAEVEPGETVTAPDLARRILRSGYLTHAADFPKIVAQALARDERFRRTGRGEYVLAIG